MRLIFFILFWTFNLAGQEYEFRSDWVEVCPTGLPPEAKEDQVDFVITPTLLTIDYTPIKLWFQRATRDSRGYARLEFRTVLGAEYIIYFYNQEVTSILFRNDRGWVHFKKRIRRA